jgi:hypothetical protein
MKYTQIKKDLKETYDGFILLTESYLKEKGIDKKDTIRDFEVFLLFCFEFDRNQEKKIELDMHLIKKQIFLMQEYLKQINQLLK